MPSHPIHTPTHSKSSLLRLVACLVYEALTVIAISLFSVWAFVLIAGDATHGAKRTLLQITLWLTVGCYFVWCWSRSGQTLAMQAWRLTLLKQNNQTISIKEASVRYILASLSLTLACIGFLWVAIDHQHRYLHDKLLGYRIIHSAK